VLHSGFGVQQLAASTQAAPFAAAQAARIVVARRPDAEILALWLADAVLALLGRGCGGRAGCGEWGSVVVR
jgi:hypothetical protein